MLKDLTGEKLIRLNIETADWGEAIRKSTQLLIDEHKVKPSYVDDTITRVKENGPYTALTKCVALPHTRPESGALESAIGVATLKTSVVFGNGANDSVKYLLCLSIKDNTEHLNVLAKLAEMSEDAQFYRFLEYAESAKEIMEYISRQRKEETDMYKALVCCRAGTGSNMLLKIKADWVINESGYPIQTGHGNLDSLNGLSGDLVTTMDDLVDELKNKVPYALGVRNIMDKVEMKFKMEEFFATKQERIRERIKNN